MDGTILEKKLKLMEKLQQLDEVAQKVDDMPVYTSVDRDWLDEWEENLPKLPTEDGETVLKATTTEGETVLSWGEAGGSVFDFTGEVATGWIWENGKELFLRKITNINAGDNSQVRTQIGTDAFYDKAFLIFGWVERNVDGVHTKIPLPVSWPGETNALWQITVDDTTHKAYVDRRMPIAVLQLCPVTFLMGYTKVTATRKTTKKKVEE